MVHKEDPSLLRARNTSVHIQRYNDEGGSSLRNKTELVEGSRIDGKGWPSGQRLHSYVGQRFVKTAQGRNSKNDDFSRCLGFQVDTNYRPTEHNKISLCI